MQRARPSRGTRGKARSPRATNVARGRRTATVFRGVRGSVRVSVDSGPRCAGKEARRRTHPGAWRARPRSLRSAPFGVERGSGDNRTGRWRPRTAASADTVRPRPWARSSRSAAPERDLRPHGPGCGGDARRGEGDGRGVGRRCAGARRRCGAGQSVAGREYGPEAASWPLAKTMLLYRRGKYESKQEKLLAPARRTVPRRRPGGRGPRARVAAGRWASRALAGSFGAPLEWE
jgi:hypothetical protein